MLEIKNYSMSYKKGKPVVKNLNLESLLSLAIMWQEKLQRSNR